MVTQDPGTGAVRKSSGFVRTAGERIVLDIVLLGRGSVEGVVRDLANRPVAGAQVVALSASDPQSGGQAVTDGLGHYRIDGITVGPLNIKAAKGIALGRAAGRIDRAGTVSPVDVVLDGGAARVSGTVRRVVGGVETTVPGVGVVYGIDPAPNPTPVGYVKTGPDGRFQFEAMPAGVVVLRTSLDTGETASTPFFTVAAGDDLQNKDLLVVAPEAAETGSVDGVIHLPGGAPAAQALVAIGSRGVLTANDGSFVLTGASRSSPAPRRASRPRRATGSAWARLRSSSITLATWPTSHSPSPGWAPRASPSWTPRACPSSARRSASCPPPAPTLAGARSARPAPTAASPTTACPWAA